MPQKNIHFFIATFLSILVIIPITIFIFSRQVNNPGVVAPSPTVLQPTIVISSPTPIQSGPTPIESFPKSGLEMTIFKNKEAQVPYTTLLIKLISVSAPSDKCFDCISSANIQVRDSSQLTELKYTSGGFSGTLVDKQEAFGYIFKIDNLKEDSLRVKITKK